MRIKIALTAIVTLTITACESAPKNPMDFQYWQRSSVSSAIYMQGPKAQQALHRDIARCVSEVKELQHLNKSKSPFIINKSTQRLHNPDQKKHMGYNTPEYNGYLLSEHTNYHDFDSCMAHKGWERTQYIPYDISERARNSYIKSIKSTAYQSSLKKPHETQQTGGEGLN